MYALFLSNQSTESLYLGSAISMDSIAGKKTAVFVEGIFISDHKTDMVYRANQLSCEFIRTDG